MLMVDKALNDKLNIKKRPLTEKIDSTKNENSEEQNPTHKSMYRKTSLA